MDVGDIEGALWQSIELPVGRCTCSDLGLQFILINCFGGYGIVLCGKDRPDTLHKSPASIHSTERILGECLRR